MDADHCANFLQDSVAILLVVGKKVLKDRRISPAIHRRAALTYSSTYRDVNCGLCKNGAS